MYLADVPDLKHLRIFEMQVAVAAGLKGLRPKLPEEMGGLKPLLLQCWHADPLARSDSVRY